MPPQASPLPVRHDPKTGGEGGAVGSPVPAPPSPAPPSPSPLSSASREQLLKYLTESAKKLKLLDRRNAELAAAAAAATSAAATSAADAAAAKAKVGKGEGGEGGGGG